MKFFKKMKDGGAESTVTGYWLVEIKSLFSIVLLRFDGYSREAFHEHAFNCWNWLIAGALRETFVNNSRSTRSYVEGDTFIIRREDFHKVDSIGGAKAWLLSIRGPWSKTWKEYLPNENRERTLTHGRVEV
jgi:hypothetical protein